MCVCVCVWCHGCVRGYTSVLSWHDGGKYNNINTWLISCFSKQAFQAKAETPAENVRRTKQVWWPQQWRLLFTARLWNRAAGFCSDMWKRERPVTFVSLPPPDAAEEFFEYDAEEFLVFLTLLITEGRTPEYSVKGRTEGLHCPPAQSAMPPLHKHECSDKLPQVANTVPASRQTRLKGFGQVTFLSQRRKRLKQSEYELIVLWTFSTNFIYF